MLISLPKLYPNTKRKVMVMSNPDVIRLSSVDSQRRSNRKRKPKYSCKPWEYKDEEGRIAYVSALVRTNIRRQERVNGAYNPDNDPFIPLLNTDDIYKLQLNAILPLNYQGDTNV